ncbi:MAG TPA: hypothetical protein VFH40_01620 [Gemmatimonadales bacterium]|nr:hypothetical protein [Gemmatimonadales bacterium]
MSALPETWLVHLIRMAEEDPDMLQSGRRSMPSIENWHFDTFHAVWRNREVAKATVMQARCGLVESEPRHPSLRSPRL